MHSTIPAMIGRCMSRFLRETLNLQQSTLNVMKVKTVTRSGYFLIMVAMVANEVYSYIDISNKNLGTYFRIDC